MPEEVWFEKLPNPFDFWRGFPPLYAAGMAAQTDFAAGAFMRGVIENNADNGVLVRSQTPLGDEQQEQIIAALRDRKRKAGTADRPVFLNGVTEILQPRLSSSDLQFLDNRKFSRAEICAAFGVPEEIVTTTEHAKYDVMAGARLNFIENRVAPLCSRLEAEEEATVRSIDPQASGWFDLDSLPIMQEARRQRLTAARTGFDMGLPFNELNRVLDLGFKPLAWGDRGYIGSKLQEVGNGRANAAEETVVPVRVAERQLVANEPVPVDAMTRAEALLGGLKTGGDSEPQRQLLSKLQRFNFEQRGRVLAKLAEQLDELNGGGRLKPDFLLDLPTENRLLTERLQPVLVQAKGTSAEEFLEGINRFNQLRLEQLREVCAQALAMGESREQLNARVKGLYNHTPECWNVDKR